MHAKYAAHVRPFFIEEVEELRAFHRKCVNLVPELNHEIQMLRR